MSGKKKRHHHEEHEEHVNHEAWVIPYADMLTLLMAMFLVLWAIGQVDVSKAKAVSTGFADEFGLSTAPGSGAGGVGVLDGVEKPNEAVKSVEKSQKIDKTMAIAQQKAQAQAAARSAKQLQDVKEEIAAEANASGFGNSIKFTTEERGLVVSIVSEGVLFGPGSASLEPAGRLILDGLAKSLVDLPNQLSVEGHTDNRPISTPQFPSNWELSTDRATAVLRYLVSHHPIPTKRVSAAGYADQRPVADNETDGGRARNRRVDIAILGTANVQGATP